MSKLRKISLNSDSLNDLKQLVGEDFLQVIGNKTEFKKELRLNDQLLTIEYRPGFNDCFLRRADNNPYQSRIRINLGQGVPTELTIFDDPNNYFGELFKNVGNGALAKLLGGPGQGRRGLENQALSAEMNVKLQYLRDNGLTKNDIKELLEKSPGLLNHKMEELSKRFTFYQQYDSFYDLKKYGSNIAAEVMEARINYLELNNINFKASDLLVSNEEFKGKYGLSETTLKKYFNVRLNKDEQLGFKHKLNIARGIQQDLKALRSAAEDLAVQDQFGISLTAVENQLKEVQKQNFTEASRILVSKKKEITSWLKSNEGFKEVEKLMRHNDTWNKYQALRESFQKIRAEIDRNFTVRQIAPNIKFVTKEDNILNDPKLLFHGIGSSDVMAFKRIILEEGILSQKTALDKSVKISRKYDGFNGDFSISVAKSPGFRGETHRAFEYYIKYNLSFVIKDTESYQISPNSPNYSGFADEAFVSGEIPIENIKGIMVPQELLARPLSEIPFGVATQDAGLIAQRCLNTIEQLNKECNYNGDLMELKKLIAENNNDQNFGVKNETIQKIDEFMSKYTEEAFKSKLGKNVVTLQDVIQLYKPQGMKLYNNDGQEIKFGRSIER